MKTLQDLTVGDEIVLVYRSGKVTDGKSEDRAVRGVVITAKRVNLIVEEKEGRLKIKRSWTVRRDTRKENGNTTSYGWIGYTVQEYERNECRDAAVRFLREQRISIGLDSPWRGDDRRIELADLIRRHLDEDK
jgi:hypothetical protein